MRTFTNFIKNVFFIIFAFIAFTIMLFGSMMAEAQEPATRFSVTAQHCELMSEFDLRINGEMIPTDDFTVVCQGSRAVITVRRSVQQDAEVALSGFVRIERRARPANSRESIDRLIEASRCYDPPVGSARETECRRRRPSDSLDALMDALRNYDRRSER